MKLKGPASTGSTCACLVDWDVELVAALWDNGIIDGFPIVGACCRSLGQWGIIDGFPIVGLVAALWDNGIIDDFRLLELVALSGTWAL